MPAGSEAGPTRDGAGPPALPRTWRPLGPRVAGLVAAAALLAVGAGAWFSFDGETQASFTPFQRGTIAALTLLALAVIHALVRSRVVAEEGRLVVVNGYRRRELHWAEVVSVNLPQGAPWVSLDLADGRTQAVMAIQGSDGARARRAVRDLRALVDAGAAGAGTG